MWIITISFNKTPICCWLTVCCRFFQKKLSSDFHLLCSLALKWNSLFKTNGIVCIKVKIWIFVESEWISNRNHYRINGKSNSNNIRQQIRINRVRHSRAQIHFGFWHFVNHNPIQVIFRRWHFLINIKKNQTMAMKLNDLRVL